MFFSADDQAAFNDEIFDDPTAFRLYAYLCKRARSSETEYKDKTVGIGQFLISYKDLGEAIKTKKKATNKKLIFDAAKKLQAAGLIEISAKKEGTLFTVIANKNAIERKQNAQKVTPSTLQPQGIQPKQVTDIGVKITEKVTEKVTPSTLQPQGLGHDRGNGYSNGKSNDIYNHNVFNNHNELLTKEKQQKIAQSESIVNTFSTAFNYILTRFENEFLTDKLEANEGQIKAIKQFAQQMDLDLLTALFNEAAEGARENPVSYFFKICRKNMQNGITTLDKKLQTAALYRQRTGTDGRQQQTGRQLSPKDTSGNFDNLPF